MYVKHGIAYRDEDTIYVNDVLLKDKRVYDEVIKHEMNHYPGAYSFEDLILDLTPSSLNTMLFCLAYPSTWTAFSPIVKIDGIWRYDLATLFMMGLSFILGGALCYLIL